MLTWSLSLRGDYSQEDQAGCWPRGGGHLGSQNAVCAPVSGETLKGRWGCEAAKNTTTLELFMGQFLLPSFP